jgi:hypothetical protein
MKMLTLPVTTMYVTCCEDDDLEEEFGAGQFEAAEQYLEECRKNNPNKVIELVAVVDA